MCAVLEGGEWGCSRGDTAETTDPSAAQTIRCWRSSCPRLIGRSAQYQQEKTVLCRQACTACFFLLLLSQIVCTNF